MSFRIEKPQLYFTVLDGLVHLVVVVEDDWHDEKMNLLGNSCRKKVSWDSVVYNRPEGLPLCPVCVEKLLHIYFKMDNRINPCDMSEFAELLKQRGSNSSKPELR